MKIAIIMHADFETPGVIENWARERQYRVTIFKPYSNQILPYVEELDFLIVMGGPQSPLVLEEAPYLKDEINLIRKVIQAQKPVLGFCLGAQLIGEALGAPTEKSPHREIGVYPITLTPLGLKDDLFRGFPEIFDVIHWHNDMPGLTQEAQLLALSEGCPRQAIRYSDKVYGFQFHMEITQEGLKDLIKFCPNDLNPGKFVQTKEVLNCHDLKDIHQQMFIILDRLCEKIFLT